jgi:hypothetical protein
MSTKIVILKKVKIMLNFTNYAKANNKYCEFINILGLKCKDKVTGFSGVITTISFDLYGCVQAIVTPDAESGKNCAWFDVTRLDITNDRVMDVPDFNEGYIADGRKGCSDKPLK